MTTLSRIHKLVLDFSFSKNQVNPSELHQRTKQLYDTELYDTLNNSLEGLSDHSKLIIDKLVIELGTIASKDLKSRFANELHAQLHSYQNHLYRPEQNSDTLPLQTTALDVVLHFMTSGAFPWYSHFDMVDINKEWLHAVENKNPQLREFLFTQMLNNIHVRSRVVYQLDRDVLLKTIAWLLPEAEWIDPAFFTDWISVRSDASSNEIYYISEILRFILSKNETKLTSVLVRNFIREIVFDNNIPLQLDIKSLTENIIRLYSDPKKTDAVVSRPKVLQKLFKSSANEVQQSLEQLSVAEAERSNHGENFTEASSWHALNCGLVLLHPFLSRFFMELELVSSDGHFLSHKHQMQACQILHYLASCEKKTPEHQLVIPKLLCGIPLHHPIPKTLRLRPAHKQMCLELLDAVAEHWTALRGTSGEGLRRTFIQREGLLKYESGVWTVFVERKTEDILLEQLPWSFSSFQNSWNKELIYVDWA